MRPPTPHSPLGVRIAAGTGPSRSPHVEAEPGHGKGWYEVQDEGSQAGDAARRRRSRKQQIIDLCAGAGGKTLGLAAAMENTGQLYAYDADRMRLRPIFERLKRAGVRNAQVLDRGRRAKRLPGLRARWTCVVVDAPCTGSGVWRRRPDAKWRLSPQMLEARLAEQTRRARPGRAAGEARRPARLYHLLGAAVREPRSGRGLPRPLPAVQHRALAGACGRRPRSLLHRRNRPTAPARRC